MSAILYEHEDGRHAVAPSAEAATFAHGDPKWHRVGPVAVHGVQPLMVALADCLFHLEVDYGKYHPVCVQARGALESASGTREEGTR